MSLDRQTFEALAAFAKNSKLLSFLDRPGLLRLAEHGAVQQTQAGETIVRQGDAGDTFYLIAAGELSVRVREAENKEVARLGAGMFFGEIAVVTRQPRSATVVALVASRLLRFPRAPLMELIRDYPQLREVIGSVGLARAEENLRRAQAEEKPGLAELLEGDDEPDLSHLVDDEAATQDSDDDGIDVDIDGDEPSGKIS